MLFDPEYLESAAQRPVIRHIKQKSYEHMQIQEGHGVLDVGCGPGIDTMNMAELVGSTGNVFGVDSDPAMIRIANEKAREKNISSKVVHHPGIGSDLQFEDNSFDSCRCERVLQHLPVIEGYRTVSEMFRVTRPGGKIVCIDTDWCSFSTHYPVPSVERLFSRVIVNNVQNGFAARGMADLFHQHNIKDIQWEVFALPLTFQEFSTLLRPLVYSSILKGSIDHAVPDQIYALGALAGQKNIFYSTINMIICYGNKPE